MNRVYKVILSMFENIEEYEKFLSNKADYYKTYYIKTKSKVRRIDAPNEWLRSLQKKLSYFYLALTPHKCVTAYEEGCSTKANALRHKRAKHILHMDIKDFYPSIGYRQFESVYGKVYNKEELDVLWKVASLENGLPIGSCISPIIANRVMYKMDAKLSHLSLTTKYTRYADDMIFSSKKFIDKTVSDKVNSIIRDNGYRVNPKKTYFMGKRLQVTGILILPGGRLSLGTAYKKSLKGEIYKLLVKGEGNFAGIVGRIAYLNYIEPLYAMKLRLKYGGLDKIRLFIRAGMKKSTTFYLKELSRMI